MYGRQRVLWVGPGPEPAFASKFSERGLELLVTTLGQFDSHVAYSRAAVFWLPSDAELEALCQRYLAVALSHGLLVFVIVEQQRLSALRLAVDPLPFKKRLKLTIPANADTIPESSARHDAGPLQSESVALTGCGGCEGEDLLLLQRAFSDCGEVRLHALEGGGAVVFQAFAKLRDSRCGPYPLPFFVKLDRYTKIERELANYRDCTTHFIPFFARPNLSAARCLLGAIRGIIVGDFVEHSDSLADLVQRGTAQRAIDSLFQDALRGWRTQAYYSNAGVRNGALDTAIKSFPERAQIRARRYSGEARQLGAAHDSEAIGQLLDALPPIEHRRALCHNDLHGENVRVRSGDAILIDFYAVREGPLMMDPAALETSLVLKFRVQDESSWRSVVADLYQVDNLVALPQLRAPTLPFNELWNSVRQVRRFGLAEQMSDAEYARAVAIQLLRHATRPRGGVEDRLRRPWLLKLASDLASNLTARYRPVAQRDVDRTALGR